RPVGRSFGPIARSNAALGGSSRKTPRNPGKSAAAARGRSGSINSAEHNCAQLPIVILTSLGHSTAPTALGIAVSLVKPVKPRVLFDRLVKIFHGRKVRRLAVADSAGTGENLAESHPLAILLAEDNPVNQRVAKLMLQRLGYRADSALNGREVLAAVERRSYDLVFMDMQMPEIDGLQATREICRRLPFGERPRIVAMTANASPADREQCLAAGMDEFMTKPVRLQDLRRELLATPVRGVPVA
ncbi:MAG: response regulator, partial [Opitutus sp.]|nr:response regulator [Opitutus sp.]